MDKERVFEVIDKEFHRMRGKLFTLIEGSVDNERKIKSINRYIRNITGEAWNNIKNNIEE